MSMDLILVRHGQTDWNPLGKVMGRQAIPLNAAGRGQALAAAEWLKTIEFHAVYSSPMQRAVETAEIIGAANDLAEVMAEEGVAEIDYGDWVNMTFAEVAEKYKKEHEEYRHAPSRMRVPGGENIAEVQKRAVAAIERIRQKHEGERAVVVSHADVIKAILVHCLGLPLDVMQMIGCDNGSVSIFRFGTEWGDRLAALNYFADVKKILPW